ncbi:hypothetical protein ACFL5U_00210 [Candidatus Margulisiibacteriota bacterium]
MKISNHVIWGTITRLLQPREIALVAAEVARVRKQHPHIIFPVTHYTAEVISQIKSHLFDPETDLIVAGFPASGKEQVTPDDAEQVLFPANLIARPADSPVCIMSGGVSVFALGNMVLNWQLQQERKIDVFSRPFVRGRAPNKLDVEYTFPPDVVSAIDPEATKVLIHFATGTFNREVTALLASDFGFDCVAHAGHDITAEHLRPLHFGGWDLGEVGAIRCSPRDDTLLEVPYRLVSSERPGVTLINRGVEVSGENLMRVMVIGDVAGRLGVDALDRFLDLQTAKPDFIIVQTENCGAGEVPEKEGAVSEGTCLEMFDVLAKQMGERYFGTGGNHSFDYILGRALRENMTPLDLSHPSVTGHLSLPFNIDVTTDREIKPGLNLHHAARILKIDQSWLQDWSNYMVNIDGARLLILSLLLEEACPEGEAYPVLDARGFLPSLAVKLRAFFPGVDGIFMDVHSETTQEREKLHAAIMDLGAGSRLSAAWCTHQHAQQTKAYLEDGRLLAYDIGAVTPLVTYGHRGWIRFIAGDCKMYDIQPEIAQLLSPKVLVTGLEFLFDPGQARVVDYSFIQEIV